ncbi:MAG: phosphoenolpyruvate--protein phosphotransferase [Clostridia bacterium]|nr:phosphoenolpyruvate--protein phosphotransferase [Clostridia bacterium]
MDARFASIGGTGIGEGAALGRFHWLSARPSVRREEVQRTPEEEETRFRQAQARAGAALDALYAESRSAVGEDAAQIFAVHAMIAADEDFTDLVVARIGAGDTAETAVIAAADTLAARFREMEDEYLRARAADFADIAARLCDILDADGAGTGEPPLPDWPEPIILAAQDLSPSQTVGLDRSRIAGFVTGAGSPGSHTAILARSLGLPALVGAHLLDEMTARALEGRQVLLDAAAGRLTVDPTPEEQAAIRAREAAARAAEQARYALVDCPAETRAGKRILLCANIGLPSEAHEAAALGADGVGLMRSEFLYLGRVAPPGEEEQFTAYCTAAEALGDRMLVIRTLDIGADKQADYLGLPPEENPALGLRAIRLCLARRPLFRVQLRAICRAAGRRPGQIAVMFPMICAPHELDEAIAELREVQADLRRAGEPVDERMAVGMMIETPAAALLADTFAPRCAFFSIGSNDLTQYTLAVDRQNNAVAPLAVDAHPAVLTLIARTAAAIHAVGGWCGLCGELAADPTMTETLLAMGIDELSVSPSQLLRIKERVREIGELPQTETKEEPIWNTRFLPR